MKRNQNNFNFYPKGVFLCLILVSLLLSSSTIHSQTTILNDPDITLTFPNAKWKFSDSLQTENGKMYAYSTSRSKFDKKASLLLIEVVKNKINKTASAYADELSRMNPRKILARYSNLSSELPIPGIPDAMTHKFTGLSFEMDMATKGFTTIIVNKGKGIAITLIVNETLFDDVEEEFITMIKSLNCKSCIKASQESKTKITPQVINICDYFPLKSRMSYTYIAENSDLPVKTTIKTVYTATTGKTVQGKPFKGYRVTSDDFTKKGNIFYQCSPNGVLAHAEIIELDMNIFNPSNAELEHTGNFLTFYEIKGNLKVGDSWEEVQLLEGKEQEVLATLDETYPEFILGDKTYKDVIKITRTVTETTLLGDNKLIQEAYYAKGIGKIKTIYRMINSLTQKIKTEELVSYSLN